MDKVYQHVDMAAYAADIQIDGLSQIAHICNQLPQALTSDQVFWRGHGNSEWPLLPQVFRPNLQAPDFPKYNERVLISAFQARAPSRSHVKVPESGDYSGWLFFAQHYGLPTRLLDWTESPLIALYFAVENPEEKDDGCIWALRPGGLNAYFSFRDNLAYRRAVENDTDPQTMETDNGGIQDPYRFTKYPISANGLVTDVLTLIEDAFHNVPGSPGRAPEGVLAEEAILAIDGRDTDIRMLVQMGRFTVHTSSRSPIRAKLVGWVERQRNPSPLAEIALLIRSTAARVAG